MCTYNKQLEQLGKGGPFVSDAVFSHAHHSIRQECSSEPLIFFGCSYTGS
jgi:hypothetical protein